MPEIDIQTEPGRVRIGSIVGWVIFILLLSGAVYFGYRVWFYVDKIRRGDIISLPQYTDQLTRVAGGLDLGGLPVDRALVESGDRPSLGQGQDTKLTIVMFGDFSCGYTRDAAETVRRLMAKYGDRVRLTYRHYPLAAIHPNAYQAAVASECAFEQDKFWPYFDKLYANQSALRLDDLIRYGDEVGLDRERFGRCLVDNRYVGRVNEDLDLADRLALRGTPTYFLNGIRVEGNIPEPAFEGFIERLLK